MLKCSNEWGAFKAANSTNAARNAAGLFFGVPNGWVQYFMNLAWDVATLLHATELPGSLVDRLRDHEQFQGARYEVAVAAIFARLDFEVGYLDDKALHGQKHVEFVATHRPTGLQIAVEAKSRHREGVINIAGQRVEDAVVRGDVRRVFNRALEKEVAGIPYLIFIDVNAPANLRTGSENQWQKDVKAWMEEAHRESSGASTYSALAVTNFAPHYDGDELAQGSEWLYLVPPDAALRIPDLCAAMIREALDNYFKIPAISEGGELLG